MTSPRSNFTRKYRKEFVPLDQLHKELVDTEPVNLTEIWETIYERHGKGFADGAIAEMEKQEDKRVKNFGVVKQKAVQPTLL